ncbi:YdeI/OmpD-associated family protein [uncultured Croceitalea sp.]|uniref:YdeI/OmpD-associated family protein n=1 Tax=uncultured Croceitalea sp. TaxID=1798908 RepID=UPI0033061D36
MDKAEKIEAYFGEPHPFKEAIGLLRDLTLKTEVEETYKWQFPTYTIGGKNVFAICKFNSHFGIWFFNGVFLTDPKKVLENAQEGKTKAMRHWKFTSIDAIDERAVSHYLSEAIENQKQGRVLGTTAKQTLKKLQIPELLKSALQAEKVVLHSFNELPPYKQKEYCEYIATAKQEKTKLRRLEKIIPMIRNGVGLSDAYR